MTRALAASLAALGAAAVLAAGPASPPPARSAEPARSAAAGGPVLEGSTAYNSQRKVAVSPDGARVAVTYVAPADDVSTIGVKVSSDAGGTWRRLPVASRGDAFRATVAWDGRGRLHLAWTEEVGPHRQVLYARWDRGPAWVDRVQLSATPGYSGYPALGVDSRDGLHLVWYGFDGAQYQVYYRHRPPDGAWTPTVQATRQVGDANAPAIAIGPDDRAHVAFYGFVEGRHETYYMVGGPQGWSPAERVEGRDAPAALPSIVVREDGTPAVAYVAGERAATAVVFAARRTQGGWGAPEPVSPPGERADDPSLAQLPGEAGDLIAAYDTPSGDVRLARRAAGGGPWRPAGTLPGEAPGAWPSLSWAPWPAGARSTAVYAAWTESPAANEVSEGAPAHRLAVARVEGDRAVRLREATAAVAGPLTAWLGLGIALGAGFVWVAVARARRLGDGRA